MPAGRHPFVATPADAPALASHSRAAFGPAEALSAGTFRQRMTRGSAVVVGLRDEVGAIIAYLMLYRHRRTRRAYINESFVHPSRRGEGLASILMAAAELEARAAGMATLAAHVRVSNLPSLRAKLRQGLAVVARLPGWYPGPEDALYLKKILV